MPRDRIRYLHIAGHEQVSDDLLIDTHGAAIRDPVWELLQFTYQQHGVKPTLLNVILIFRHGKNYELNLRKLNVYKNI